MLLSPLHLSSSKTGYASSVHECLFNLVSGPFQSATRYPVSLSAAVHHDCSSRDDIKVLIMPSIVATAPIPVLKVTSSNLEHQQQQRRQQQQQWQQQQQQQPR